MEASKILRRAQADPQAIWEGTSWQASERASTAGGGAHEPRAGERASKQRWMWSQSLIAREGVSRWSTSRPGSAVLLNSFIHLREGSWTSIKLRFIRVRWNNFWCGEKCTLLPWITLSSTMKKPQESLYPNRSGTPKDAQDSILVHCILGVFFFTNFQSLLSLTIVHWLLSYTCL